MACTELVIDSTKEVSSASPLSPELVWVASSVSMGELIEASIEDSGTFSISWLGLREGVSVACAKLVTMFIKEVCGSSPSIAVIVWDAASVIGNKDVEASTSGVSVATSSFAIVV